MPPYKAQSPQLSLRRYFADLVAIVSNHFRLCPAARHLAVYLLDLFMDRYNVTVQQLHVVSLSCLLLASKFTSRPRSSLFKSPNAEMMLLLGAGKFEEREDRVPKLETLNNLGCMSSMNLVLTKQGLLHMELLLLETFQWNLYLPTAAHFIDYYLSIAVSEGDLHDGWPMTCLEKTKLYLAKYVDYFLEVSLQGESPTLLLLLPRGLRSCSSRPRFHPVPVSLQLLLLFGSFLQITSFCALLLRWWLLHAWPRLASSCTCPPHGRPDCSSWRATRGTT